MAVIVIDNLVFECVRVTFADVQLGKLYLRKIDPAYVSGNAIFFGRVTDRNEVGNYVADVLYIVGLDEETGAYSVTYVSEKSTVPMLLQQRNKTGSSAQGLFEIISIDGVRLD